ncbi:MAG TPA: tetratricopeptide repeat protein, partial [Chloroflexota bacterium]|nr:tetratricopeptide repeat protein [Chloroflexota bacterium]
VPGGRLLATLKGHAGPVIGVALSADGHIVASASLDRTIRLWAAEGGHLLATLEGHTGQVQNVALSGDGRLVASASFDRTVKLWAAESGQLLATLEGQSGPILGVALNEDGRLLASGGDDMAVTLWEAAPASRSPGRLMVTLQGHTGTVTAVALSADDQLVASGSVDGTARLWEAASGRLLVTMQGHSSLVWGVALSRDGRLVASASRDGTVKLWEASSGVCLRTLRADRPYERLDITGLSGVTAAQRAALLALGAVEQAPARAAQPMPERAAPLPDAATPAPPSIPAPAPPPAAAPTTARPPTNLPPARTSFVGRSSDVATLLQALDPATRAAARLLTVVGVAGCGKTRLALTVADALRDAYPDGVWLVELAPRPASSTADPTPVAEAIVSALGLHEQPGQDLVDTLVAHLQARCLLLVMDNCEHVVSACTALSARLLDAGSELRILATSQRALGIADETVWRVDTLAIPPVVDGPPTPELLSLLEESDAVQLFVARAQAVQPSFVLSAANAASVAAICRQLDGLPLAIELAAARLHMLPVEEILARLDDRFRLLRRGGRTATERHQALQATLDWSYGLLAPDEQTVLRRLAVFAGGWELAAAEVVCAGEEVAAADVLNVLDELLERSLLYVQQADLAPRYGLLDTMRQYGAQQLERADETEALRDRHLRWCVTLAEQAAPGLLGAEQGAWLARLDREHDNVRAAMQWSLDRDLHTLGLRIAAGLWKFWRSRGHLREGRRWLAALLAPAAADDAMSMAVQASALEGAAWLAEDEHDFAQASALFAQSGALRRALGEDERTSGLLINAAMEARVGGDYARATALLEESLARHRALGIRESIMHGGLGVSLSRLALVLAEQGQYSRASALYEECLALHRELGDPEGIGTALLGLGDIARDQGDAARVHAYCEESLARFRDLGYPWAVGFSLNNLALAAFLEGDLPRAASLAAESASIFRTMQSGPSLAEVLITLGRIRGALGDAAAAWADLSEALSLAGISGPRFVVATAVDALGVQAIRQGQARHGVYLLGAAARMRQAMGAPVHPADRPPIEGALAAARASLGDAAYTGAWAAGQALSVQQILAQAATVPAADRTMPERADG